MAPLGQGVLCLPAEIRGIGSSPCTVKAPSLIFWRSLAALVRDERLSKGRIEKINGDGIIDDAA